MVSLVNFKSVSELTSGTEDNDDSSTGTTSVNRNNPEDRRYLTRISIKNPSPKLDQLKQELDLHQNQQQQPKKNNKHHFKQQPIKDNKVVSPQHTTNNNNHNNYTNDSTIKHPSLHNNNHHHQQQQAIFPEKAGLILGKAKQHLHQEQKEHFEIRWNNLTYQVKPKWYKQKWEALTGSGGQQNAASSTNEQAFIGGNKSLKGNINVPNKNKTTVILNDLNGSVKSGQVTAILGPSGAGKTSLLGCLTGKKKSGVSGTVQIISNRNEPMSICTIPQKDYLLNQLTVRENLWFASRLKHPEDNFDHDSNIERVLELLKLESCIDTKISKISGGQYKRVSIAQELLSNPDILILDEPTSGLDSLTCYKTVMVLRDLAQLSPQPMAIIVTIHQPQREVFDLFNHIYILAVGGRCIYEGHPSQSIKTINTSSGGLEFDANQYNPASYLVEIASAEFGQKPIEALVEHQKRDFYKRIALQDSQQPPGQNGTPNLKKRQSPMMARFKSTLSNLKGSSNNNTDNNYSKCSSISVVDSPKGTTKQHNINNQQSTLFAYSNEAYETAGSQLDISSNINKKNLLAPNYYELDSSRVVDISSLSNNNNNNNNNDANNKSNKLHVNDTTSSRFNAGGANGGELFEEGAFYLDDRLQTHKHNHKGHFFRHCSLLTKRSWLCLCKDPMLTTLRFSAHIIVPLLITLVYGSRVGKPNACPIYETEMDLIDYAKHGAQRLLNLQVELRCTFENVGLYFLSVYAFTFSTMCLTSLSFPLNMHVLLKEVRNGWYSIPTYFIGKTLADFPLEFILPTVTLMITYPLTGQPSSYLQWRFFLATIVFVITSLIAQTQGLIFGALFMNAMQAAVFVAPVSTTPLILLSGFLIRISQMPVYLQRLSTLSYFRYAIEALTIIRYGFGQCPCDDALVRPGQPVRAAGVPDQLRTMTDYWLSTYDNGAAGDDGGLVNDTITEIISTTTSSTAAAEGVRSDFFQDLTVLLARANSFGVEIKSCNDLKPYPMIDFSLEQEQLYVWLAALVATLFVSKVVNYLVVKYSVKFRL